MALLPLIDGWIVYASSAAGLLVILLVGANIWKAWEMRKERQAVERIERYLARRFGERTVVKEWGAETRRHIAEARGAGKTTDAAKGRR